ncbi:beta-1,4-N-acetylgalactosaminyltransferase bre-4-like, partial [Argonauta hians]
GVQKFNKTGITWREIENKYGHTLSAGHYTPDCIIKTSVAIIIPYRDRQQHLKILVSTLHAMLQRQVVEYGIYVVAQTDSHPFNRGMLMNVGFLEAIKLHKYNCFIFHDVDLIPENDKNIYNCEGSPKHLSVAVSTFQYKLPYKYIFGGVNAMNKKDFEKVNGFSNRFFGWGGEDDDLYRRIIKNNLLLHRGPIQVSRYTMLRHNKNKPNTERVKILDDPEYENDGLNSVDYTVEELTSRTLFTYIKVKLETD